MSKNSKNQKSITSFFKNSAQPKTSKFKAPPNVETQVVKDEPDNMPSSSTRTASERFVASSEQPTVMDCSLTTTDQSKSTHEIEWINLSDRFLLKNRTFDVQYAHFYAERLGTMRKMVVKAAENRWGLFILSKRKLEE